MRSSSHFLRPQTAVFWTVSTAGLLLTWRFLPTPLAQIAYSALYLFAVAVAFLKHDRIAGLCAIFFILVSVNYWLLDESITSVIAGAALVVSALLVGRTIHNNETSSTPLVYWLLLGVAVAQTNAILSQWPISFFNRALLSGISFYLFWQIIELRDEQSSQRYISHFLFVGLTVIVVIGSIIWANFPQLIPF